MRKIFHHAFYSERIKANPNDYEARILRAARRPIPPSPT